MSDSTATDATVGGNLKTIPTGYNYSVRLGDAITSSDGGNFRCWQQKIQYELPVTASNSLLIMKFACVLQYASDHTTTVEPRFKLTLYDSSGNEINTCINYDVYAGAGTGFQSYTSSNSLYSNASTIKWRDWTTVGANLTNYIGQNITIEFMATDCTGRFHFGYAYFVADCQSMSISATYCGSADKATLTAPEGFTSYVWKDASGTILNPSDATLSSIAVSAADGDLFSCTMTSATGCVSTLSTTVYKYIPNPDFTSAMVGSCKDNQVQFTNTSTTNRGTMNYLWNFGDGETSTDKNPLHAYSTSGHHSVTLTASMNESTCTKDTTIDVESINTDLVTLKAASDSICVGESTGKLTASGAWLYEWSTDPGNYVVDSVKTGLSAGTYWVVGYSSPAHTPTCYSSKHSVTLVEEKNWLGTLSGNSYFCTGDSTKLCSSWGYKNASGEIGDAKSPLTYLWSNGKTTDNATLKTAGTYTVTATDESGCGKTVSVDVSEKLLPLVAIDVSPTTINAKHNQVACNIAQEGNVTYQWDFGDGGSTESGNSVSHTYNADKPAGLYTILMKAANTQYGCLNSSSATVIIEPFVPNVFSPNGDGYNDCFMPYYEMSVYDRWGVLLYTGTTESVGWNGLYKGKKVDSDTYFYILYYTDYKNERKIKKGYVTLIR
jgi:gliding motility-associated-like protein